MLLSLWSLFVLIASNDPKSDWFSFIESDAMLIYLGFKLLVDAYYLI